MRFSHKILAIFPSYILVLALVAGCLSAVICWKSLGMIPHVSDEISYAFQGRILASGKLWADPPPSKDLFQLDHIILNDERWCSKYTPGWPLLLALGWIAGVPWLVNPVIFALSVLGVWKLATLLFDTKTATVAAVLIAVSPFSVMMGAGFMAHMAGMCLAVWTLVALVKAGESPMPKYAITAGFLGAFIFLIRPYTGALILWPAILWTLFRAAKQNRLTACTAWLSIGFVTLGGLLLMFNFLSFGHPFLSGYRVFDPEHKMTGRFGKTFPLMEIFARNTRWYFQAMNRYLWSWPWPDLLIFLPMLRPRRDWSKDLMLALCAFSLIAGYLFYYSIDIVYAGPRLMFEAMGFLAILAARSTVSLADLISGLIQRESSRRAVLIALVAVLTLLPLTIKLPAQIAYHADSYHAQTAIPLQVLNQKGLGDNALVFVSGSPSILGSFFFENELEPQKGGRVFVTDIPELRDAAMKAFPRKEIWRVGVQFEPLPGPNFYVDRLKIREVRVGRIR